MKKQNKKKEEEKNWGDSFVAALILFIIILFIFGGGFITGHNAGFDEGFQTGTIIESHSQNNKDLEIRHLTKVKELCIDKFDMYEQQITEYKSQLESLQVSKPPVKDYSKISCLVNVKDWDSDLQQYVETDTYEYSDNCYKVVEE